MNTRRKKEDRGLIIFAIKNGQKVHIDSVDNGNDCNCFCPGCGRPLCARNKGKQRLHHFAHINNENFKIKCLHSDSKETILHWYAKDIISKEKKNKNMPLLL